MSVVESENYPARNGDVESDPKLHQRCLKWRNKAITASSYVRFMLEEMKKLGCEVNMKRHLVCEPCSGRVLGGFDHRRQQIVLCENTIYSETCMSEVLTHELIHAYDFCRYNTNFSDVKHLACSEIRAANLSGDCFFWKENFGRFKFGWKKHQQACVRERAVNSILCVKDIEKSEAENVVDSVFASCFYNTEPFEHVPP